MQTESENPKPTPRLFFNYYVVGYSKLPITFAPLRVFFAHLREIAQNRIYVFKTALVCCLKKNCRFLF